MSAELRSGRIHRDEWPKITGRRANGESLAAIGRDYGVTGSAISQILKKAALQGSDRAVKPETPAPEIDIEPRFEPMTPVAEVQIPDPEAHERSQAAHPNAPKPALAERLNSAAHECAELVTDAAQRPFDEAAERAIKAAIHQVRMALAGIEIGLARRNLTAAVDSAPQATRERQEYRPRFADQPALAQQPSLAQPTLSAPSPAAAPPAVVASAPGSSFIEGKVKFFTRAKGFGFVVPDDGGAEIYVSIRALQKSGIQNLVAQQRVRVAVADSTRGPEADHIELIAA